MTERTALGKAVLKAFRKYKWKEVREAYCDLLAEELWGWDKQSLIDEIMACYQGGLGAIFAGQPITKMKREEFAKFLVAEFETLDKFEEWIAEEFKEQCDVVRS